MQQREFLDFLVGRKQVALDAFGEQRCAFGIEREAVARGAFRDPARQSPDLDRPGEHDGAVLLEGLEPRGRIGRASRGAWS